ncbi:MAG: transcription-repair coupling factor [Candidatus Eremiobacteraeota bacterium]|nr:transcription-repair coupling factor [Candidatus Eremiobacteraeota bacterium]MBC5826395.1 transcription-repair coupling factor [Candidatus Eremiobacteraeota bacterium]
MSADFGASLARGLAASSSALATAVQALAAGACVDIKETAGPARPFVVASLWQALGGQCVIWTHTPDAADRFATDCGFYLGGRNDEVWTIRPRDDGGGRPNPTEQSARREALDALLSGRPGIYCVSQAALRQTVSAPETVRGAARILEVGADYAWDSLLASLVTLGYERVDVVTAVGEFAVHGGLIDVFPATAALPVRLEFFGDRLESARTFALSDQRSVGDIRRVAVTPWTEALGSERVCLLAYATGALIVVDDPESIAIVDRTLAIERDDATIAAADSEDENDGTASEHPSPPQPQEDDVFAAAPRLELAEIAAQTDGHAVAAFAPATATQRASRAADVSVAIPAENAPAYGRSIENFAADVRQRVARGEAVAVITLGHRRIREVLAEHAIAPAALPRGLHLRESAGRGAHGQRGAVYVAEGIIDSGFAMPAFGLTVLGDAELFGHPARRQKLKAAKEGVPVTEADLRPGEYFVHAYHGIGRYLGLEHLAINDIERDFILLQYAGDDRLYVPIDQMHMVRRYSSSDEAVPRLSKMGGGDWARTRSRVREAVDKIAEGLVRLYAAREAAAGHAFAPDTPWQAELEETFPYDETEDQRKAIDALKADMERPRPMDRLICGDVGYGKTEVAIRGAFKAVMDRKQVAVLVPTTVLAAQHFRTFSERFAAFPVNIALLSRFAAKSAQKEALRGLHDGSVDLVIGTHRILQKDVGFSRLGLVIVDEEQRFGVMHKERLKELRQSVDVLTLSATPIPRTLHMSMVGVRDLSLIQTAPVDRIAIKTIVAPTSDPLIATALRQELERGGQVYFVHNRVETIFGVAAALQRLAPRARIAIGHGQMKEGELEKVMVDFVEGNSDILVSTTIIENGLDIPNVNTIIVNNANHFGLAQLYQLRGRVGRSSHQAYAYFLYQPQRVLSEAQRSRLEAIREFTQLGSGLKLAMRDLEIRGAGNLLGRQQHGFIAAVGFDTYCQLLQEAVGQRRGEPVLPEQPPPVLDVRVSAYLPSGYVRGANQKIAFYQRLAAAQSLPEVEAIGEELSDRFGALPTPALALIELTRLRVLAAAKGVEKVSLEQRRLTLEMGRRFSLSERALPTLTSITRGNFRFTKGSIVAHLSPPPANDGQLALVREIVAAL